MGGPGSRRPGRRRDVLGILRRGLDSTLLALGHASVRDLSPADLHIPANFRRPHDEAPAPRHEPLSAPQQSGEVGV